MAVKRTTFYLLFILFTFVLQHTNADPNADIRYVHVVFMNHLDVGFDGINPIIGYAINVINKYFDDYFPLAIKTAQQARETGDVSFIYTTHPWLVSIYLDCPNSGVPQNLPGIDVKLHCPNDTMLSSFKKAIALGDITWHAFPFNAEPELLDVSLFEYGISIAHDLDEQFNKDHKFVMSQRDVPGMTRSVIPALVNKGVRAISVGVNGGSAPPAVPTAFVWRDQNSEKEVIALYHPGGYGGINIPDCVIVEGFPHALALAFRGDNQGPPAIDEVQQNFAQLRSEFPNAQVFASTFDNFVSKIEQVKSKLPVITQEIGDTWIYGVPSDPLKLEQFRQILRLRYQCIQTKQCDLSDPRFKKFNRLLIKVAEHTWGCDIKTFLHDWTNWSNPKFQQALGDQNYKITINSWIEQRAYITNAIVALGNHPLASMIKESLAAFYPKEPTPTPDYQQITNPTQTFSCDSVEIAFGTHGEISHLTTNSKVRQWASLANPLALFQYTTYTESDYKNFMSTYGYCPDCGWFPLDFGKINCSLADPKHSTFTPTLVALYKKPQSCEFLVSMKMSEESYTKYGAPKTLWLNVNVNGNNMNPSLQIDLITINKTATRLPESGYLTFNPINQGSSWKYLMQKLGEVVSPDSIVVNGSFHLHAVDSIRYTNNAQTMLLFPYDSPLANLGSLNPFPTPFKYPDMLYGVSFNLFNNIWGTNYVMWYPFLNENANTLYRFNLILATN